MVAGNLFCWKVCVQNQLSHAGREPFPPPAFPANAENGLYYVDLMIHQLMDEVSYQPYVFVSWQHQQQVPFLSHKRG